MDTVASTSNNGKMLMITDTKSRIKGQRHLKKSLSIALQKTAVWPQMAIGMGKSDCNLFGIILKSP